MSCIIKKFFDQLDKLASTYSSDKFDFEDVKNFFKGFIKIFKELKANGKKQIIDQMIKNKTSLKRIPDAQIFRMLQHYLEENEVVITRKGIIILQEYLHYIHINRVHNIKSAQFYMDVSLSLRIDEEILVPLNNLFDELFQRNLQNFFKTVLDQRKIYANYNSNLSIESEPEPEFTFEEQYELVKNCTDCYCDIIKDKIIIDQKIKRNVEIQKEIDSFHLCTIDDSDNNDIIIDSNVPRGYLSIFRGIVTLGYY